MLPWLVTIFFCLPIVELEEAAVLLPCRRRAGIEISNRRQVFVVFLLQD